MSASTAIISISADATFAERQEYRRDVLKLPGPVDRWLTANSRSTRIDFLRDYLMLEGVNTEYVECVVESVCVMVRLLRLKPNNCFKLYSVGPQRQRST